MDRYQSLFESIELLLEKDNRRTILKLYPFLGRQADEAHALDDKYSLFLTNYFVEYFIKYWIPSSGWRELDKSDENMSNMSSDKILNTKYWLKSPVLSEYLKINSSKAWADTLNRLITIKKWLRGRNEKPNPDEPKKLNLKELTFNDALNYAEQWSEYIERGYSEDVDLDIIIQYPNGWYWVDIEKDECDIVAGKAGHCGKSEFNSNGNIYVLLTPQHVIALTADVNSKTKDIRQMRANGNTKPKKKYHDMILDFMLSKKIGIKSQSFARTSYRPEGNFQMKDLSDSNFAKLESKKPELTDVSNEEIYDIIRNLGADSDEATAIVEFLVANGDVFEDYQHNRLETKHGIYNVMSSGIFEREAYDYYRNNEGYFWGEGEWGWYIEWDAVAKAIEASWGEDDNELYVTAYNNGYDNPEEFLDADVNDTDMFGNTTFLEHRKDEAGEVSAREALLDIRNQAEAAVVNYFDTTTEKAPNMYVKQSDDFKELLETYGKIEDFVSFDNYVDAHVKSSLENNELHGEQVEEYNDYYFLETH